MQDKLNANTTSGNVNSTSAETLKRIFEAVVGKRGRAVPARPRSVGGGRVHPGPRGGYGENPSLAEQRRGNDDADADGGGGGDDDNDNDDNTSSRAWRDMAASRGGGANRSVTCANCCSTLGYVSDRDADTYRLYKHLLDCGGPDDIGGRRRRPASSSSFADHTCGFFLAREMVRYAKSDAVFTFVVGLSDENGQGRVHPPASASSSGS